MAGAKSSHIYNPTLYKSNGTFHPRFLNRKRDVIGCLSLNQYPASTRFRC